MEKSTCTSPENTTAPDGPVSELNIRQARQLGDDFSAVAQEMIGILDQSIQRQKAVLERARSERTRSGQAEDEGSPAATSPPLVGRSGSLCESCKAAAAQDLHRLLDRPCSISQRSRDAGSRYVAPFSRNFHSNQSFHFLLLGAFVLFGSSLYYDSTQTSLLNMFEPNFPGT